MDPSKHSFEHILSVFGVTPTTSEVRGVGPVMHALVPFKMFLDVVPGHLTLIHSSQSSATTVPALPHSREMSVGDQHPCLIFAPVHEPIHLSDYWKAWPNGILSKLATGQSEALRDLVLLAF